MKFFIITLLTLFTIYKLTLSQEMYFPDNSSEWETITPDELSWNIAEIKNLFDFLEEKNTKSFIILKDGKIVVEKYFDSFTKDSSWYWASAGKTLTAFLIGVCQSNGLLDINNKSSDYYGTGWTSLSSEQEDQIKIIHQLTMTTGLDDSENLDCSEPACLKFLTEAGTRWSYHNAPYTLLTNLTETVTNKNYNIFTNEILSKIGSSGLWLKIGANRVFFSTARNAAKFGHLILNGGQWKNESILDDKLYFKNMISKSQDLNQSYGYLWWLNGQESYMLPSLRAIFDGPLNNNAPHDLISALGKNGQIIDISKELGLVIIRFGNAPDDFFIPTAFHKEMWEKINKIIKPINQIEFETKNAISISTENKVLQLNSDYNIKNLKLYNVLGNIYYLDNHSNNYDLSHLPTGVYFLEINIKGKQYHFKINL